MSGPVAQPTRQDARRAYSLLFFVDTSPRATLQDQRSPWLGRSPVSAAARRPAQRVLLHINMRDPSNVQQGAIGIQSISSTLRSINYDEGILRRVWHKTSSGNASKSISWIFAARFAGWIVPCSGTAARGLAKLCSSLLKGHQPPMKFLQESRCTRA
jgi:hypothetical protein